MPGLAAECGGGSIPHTAISEAFPQVLKLAACGKLRIDTEPVALADVEQAAATKHQRAQVCDRSLALSARGWGMGRPRCKA
jgi:hypothetical protein